MLTIWPASFSEEILQPRATKLDRSLLSYSVILTLKNINKLLERNMHPFPTLVGFCCIQTDVYTGTLSLSKLCCIETGKIITVSCLAASLSALTARATHFALAISHSLLRVHNMYNITFCP